MDPWYVDAMFKRRELLQGNAYRGQFIGSGSNSHRWLCIFNEADSPDGWHKIVSRYRLAATLYLETYSPRISKLQGVVFLSRDRLVSELPVANQKRDRDAKGKRMFRAKRRNARHGTRNEEYITRDREIILKSFRSFCVLFENLWLWYQWNFILPTIRRFDVRIIIKLAKFRV